MPYFTYDAREKSGKLVHGQTFSSSKRDMISRLHNDGLLIINLRETSALAAYKRRLHRKVKSQDLVLFANEMKVLLENGIPIMESIDVLSRQMSSINLIDAVTKIKKDLGNGMPFYKAISRQPQIFGDMWQYLIEAGEISGQMPFVMEQLSGLVKSMDEVRKKTINAMVYPALLVVVAVVAVLIFSFKIIPVFQGVYASLGSNKSLPLLTTIVFSACNSVRHHFLYIFLTVVALIIVIKQLISTNTGRRLFEKMIYATPVVGNLYLALAMEKFSTTLKVLLKSGILIIKAMEMAANTTQSKIFVEKIDEVKVKVAAGLAVSDALQQAGFFPPLVIELVTVGEKTGNYPGMFEEISNYYNDVIDTIITRFTALIEPAMLIIMAVVIGILVIAMYLPIFKMANL